ncbi:MAG: HlyD family efflux transporter periplasmic adaptor subunit [Cyanothece sp. SIO1E1]|nr:HlyD family efflux transporter periplasmic adaptor subunit [Cyanothece sp. SIO1E1]
MYISFKPRNKLLLTGSFELVWAITTAAGLAIAAAVPVHSKVLPATPTCTTLKQHRVEPGATLEATSTCLTLKRHVVQSGEIIEAIARHYNVLPKAVLTANPGVEPTTLQIGQILLVPIPTSTAKSPPTLFANQAPSPSNSHEQQIIHFVWLSGLGVVALGSIILMGWHWQRCRRNQMQLLDFSVITIHETALTVGQQRREQLVNWLLGLKATTGQGLISAALYCRRGVNSLCTSLMPAHMLSSQRALSGSVAPDSTAKYPQTPLLSSTAAQERAIYGGASSSTVTPVEHTANLPDTPNPAPSFKPAADPEGHWSTSVQNLLNQPPSALFPRLMLAGLGFCCAFVIWAWLGQMEEVGDAPGQLVPEGETYKIHPIELGKIVHIAVEEGQTVKVGQVMVELDTQLAAGEVERLEQLLTAYQTELMQKQALAERVRLETETRSEIAIAGIQAQEAALAQANANSVMTRELLNQLRIDADAHEDRLGRLKPLVDAGALSQESMFEAEEAWRDRQRSITQSQGELEKARSETARLQVELTQTQAEASRTQLEAQQQLQQLKVEATQLKGKITDTQNLLNAAQAQLEQQFLYAPATGVVLSLNVSNIGEVVQPGQTIAEIAPHGAPLVLSANLPNTEAGFVKMGMPVKVKFDAYPYQDFGIISGEVVALSPDAKANEQLGQVYQVEVALERDYVIEDGEKIPFKAGQTAIASIVIRRRRIVDILLDPIRKLQASGVDL